MRWSPQLQLAAVLLPPAVAVAVLFAALAPEPYMDEPFHVPQTQRFCAGRWGEWDPKITTFPGLYIFGVAAGGVEAATLHVVALLRGGQTPGQAHQPSLLCSTTALRSVNLAFAAACLPLFYRLAAQLDPQRTRQQLMLMTAACFLFPLHFFFAFLYYTDVPSLFFTLATYMATLHRRYHLAGTLGALAVLMRQTNTVWVAFALATAVIDRCLPGSVNSKRGAQARQQQGRQRLRGDSSSGSNRRGVAALPGELVRLVRQAWLLKWQLASDLWPLAAVVTAFAAFVVVNGGIVLGDKAHHTPVRHLMQPLYCLLYCTAWLSPVLWSPTALYNAMASLHAAVRRQPAATLAVLALCTAAIAFTVRFFTLVHPFLLADNRHFTFYIWRRLLNATPSARYALVPAYLYSAWAARQALSHRCSIWVAALVGATVAVLVPAHLVEFRYFTVPFYFLFLHMRTPSPRALTTVIAVFGAANVAAVYLFLAYPFYWPEGNIARFMW